MDETDHHRAAPASPSPASPANPRGPPDGPQVGGWSLRVEKERQGLSCTANLLSEGLPVRGGDLAFSGIADWNCAEVLIRV